MSKPQKIRGSATGNAIITQEIKEALAEAINNGIDSKLLSYNGNYMVFVNAHDKGASVSVSYHKFFKHRQVADLSGNELYLFFKGLGDDKLAVQAQKLVIDSVCLAVRYFYGFNIFVDKYASIKYKKLEFLVSIRDGNKISQKKYKCKDTSKDVLFIIDTKAGAIKEIQEVVEC